MVAKALNHLRRRFAALRLPKPLLMNNVNLDPEHKRQVLAEVAIERDWFKKVEPFQNLAQILSAYGSGRLAKVEITANYSPILRLRNPKLAESYPGYLTKAAKILLDEVGQRWREQAEASDIDRGIHLAVTSLVRTQPYQNTIVKAGKLADPNSVHTRGEAFDIDASGYYAGDVAINARSAVHNDFQQAFKELDAELPTPQWGDYSRYNPKVHDILRRVLDEMSREGKLHFVVEYPGTTNRVFHVCRNPNYQDETNTK